MASRDGLLQPGLPEAFRVSITLEITKFIFSTRQVGPWLIESFFAQNSESDNESVRSEPHSFVNHYANVNDTLRQSWKRQRPVRNYSSYTDSEPEGSAVVSLNGGQIVMNNMARSRAPLPGFSSFVWQRPARAAAPPAACHIWRPSRAGGRINNAFIFYTVI